MWALPSTREGIQLVNECVHLLETSNITFSSCFAFPQLKGPWLLLLLKNKTGYKNLYLLLFLILLHIPLLMITNSVIFVFRSLCSCPEQIISKYYLQRSTLLEPVFSGVVQTQNKHAQSWPGRGHIVHPKGQDSVQSKTCFLCLERVISLLHEALADLTMSAISTPDTNSCEHRGSEYAGLMY